MTRLTRRWFLASLGGAAAGCGPTDGSQLRLFQTQPSPARLPEPEVLLAYFGSQQLAPVGALGRAFRESLGEAGWGAQRQALRRRLRAMPAGTPAQRATALRGAVAREFERGERVNVVGWQLSPLEAALAGWASEWLQAQSPGVDAGGGAPSSR